MQTVNEQCSAVLDENKTQAEKTYVAPKAKPVYDVFKRIFDVVMCVIALILLSPVFLAVFFS